MGVLDQISHRASKRYGDTSALDEFSFHAPQHCDMRNVRLELDCFKKRKEYRRSIVKDHSKTINSIESVKTDSDSESTYNNTRTSDAVDLCVDLADSISNMDIDEFYPSPCKQRKRSVYDEYWDALGQSQCDTILTGSKCSTAKVLLYPEEEWAKNARTVQWTLKVNRWWKRYCTVIESSLGGSQTHSTVGRISQNRDGTLTITGHFKRKENPDFKLHLSAIITPSDIQNGYLMTGALQQGDLKRSKSMEITHFAVIPKRL